MDSLVGGPPERPEQDQVLERRPSLWPVLAVFPLVVLAGLWLAASRNLGTGPVADRSYVEWVELFRTPTGDELDEVVVAATQIAEVISVRRVEPGADGIVGGIYLEVELSGPTVRSRLNPLLEFPIVSDIVNESGSLVGDITGGPVSDAAREAGFSAVDVIAGGQMSGSWSRLLWRSGRLCVTAVGAGESTLACVEADSGVALVELGEPGNPGAVRRVMLGVVSEGCLADFDIVTIDGVSVAGDGGFWPSEDFDHWMHEVNFDAEVWLKVFGENRNSHLVAMPRVGVVLPETDVCVP